MKTIKVQSAVAGLVLVLLLACAYMLGTILVSAEESTGVVVENLSTENETIQVEVGTAEEVDTPTIVDGEDIVQDLGSDVEQNGGSEPIVETVIVEEEANTQTDEPVAAEALVQLPELSTDKDDYHPGDTATIFGRFFAPLKTFFVKIFGSDENDNNYTETTETVEADEEGSFSLSYLLDSLYRPFYEVVVSDEAGDNVAETWFRDAAVGTYDQCSNDDGDGYSGNPGTCNWTNGNLNGNNSRYQEGEATVQRLWIEGFAPGPHSVTLRYGTSKGGKHAYDYLTSWDWSEDWIPETNLCQSIPNCFGAAKSYLFIPEDPNVPNDGSLNGFELVNDNSRRFEMRGATLTSATTPVIESGTYAGDSETIITVNFTVPNSGPNCETKKVQGQDVTSCAVALFFGAHISRTSDWVPVDGRSGATSISGSPYHVALAAMDGSSVGNRDNQMQASAIPGQIIIIKDTFPDSAQDFSFTTTGNGLSNFSLDDDADGTLSNTKTFILSGSGTFTVTEAAAPGYALTNLVCVDPTSNTTVNLDTRTATINLAQSEVVTCTFTNTLQKGALIVQKTTIPGGDTTQFSINTTGSGEITGGGAGIITDATDKVYEVTAGTYSVTETVPAGWTKTGDTCQNVVVTAGATSTCTITNTKKGHIIVDKVTNPSGDTQSFNFTAGGVGYSNFSLTDAAQPNNQEVVPGKYSVAETLPAGWVQTSAVCDSGETISDLDVEPGETVTCTFTNTKNGSITIEKQVVGVDADFSFTGDLAGTLGDNDTATVSVAPGTYTSTEAANTAYALTSIVCDDGNSTGDLNTRTATFNVAAGENVKCVFTNSELPTLTLEKTVINDNGGTKTEADFQGKIDGVNQAWDTPKTLIPGSYTASETTQAGYASSAWGGDCNVNGGVTLDYGDHKVCTITNNDIAPILHLRKVVVNDDGGTKTTADFTLSANGTGSNDLSGTSPVDSGAGLIADTWALSETNVPGYTASDWVCVGGTQNGVNITVGIGGEATCTITNDDQVGKLIVHKVTDPASDTTTEFTITASADSGTVKETAQQTIVGGGMVEYDVTAGQYDVSESALSGWDMTGNTCVDVAVANGETKHCTITNTKRGHIIVDKVTYPAQSSQSFSFTAGGAGYSSFSLTDAAAPNDQEVVPGKYSVAETVPSGWAQTNAVCDSGETIADLDVEPGETVTCTFTNVKPDAKITLTPLTATNEVDDDHEVTATVLVDSGAGFVNAPNGTLMTFSFSQNTAGAAFVGGSTCNTSAGSCTITINSTSAGIVALHAATDVTPLGVALHRETDSTGGNSGDAYKTYVDASIALSPQTGTNEVGDEHEITATVTRNDGTGSSPAVGETVTFKVTTGTADFVGGVDTCVTDASGTCSIEIVDTGAGQNTIDAQVTVSVGGLELERATDADAGPDGSDEAAKTYVDARISIGDSATNNVNEPHTFTVFVEENDGEGWDPAEGEKVNFTLVSNTAGADFTGDDFCTTGVDGKCTVTINSATPGTVDVHAESGVEVGGLTLDRETDGQGGNSDDATKTYEAGKIIVKKITVGGDGDFTFTADYDANGFVLSNGEEDNSGWIATGTHSVSETVPEGWDLTSTVCESSAGGTEVASSISLQNDETVTCTFTNTKRAKIIIVKDAIPNDAQNFAFSGTLGAFTLDDDSGVVDPSDPLDEYENSKVFTNVVPGSMTVTETQPNQYWELADAACVVSGTSEAVSSNLVGGTLTLTLTPGADVTCTFVNEKLVPTRTQGFWSTHTAFTNSVFAEKFPDGMKIGDGIVHKGYITNVLSPKASSELYGAWYSNIAKKTDGKQRTALDKARMQLLQQLVTAKLNCAQFGCTASVQTMIANADTAYAGASVAAIIAAAGQLDQFNNSGDSLIVGNVGKATPKESKNLANLLFWNNP